MIRRLLSVIAGIAIGVITIIILESVSHFMYPPPDDIYFENPDRLKSIMADAPIGSLILVIVAYALGAMAGGFTTCLMANRSKKVLALTTGLILMVFGILNMIMIPHPWWFWLMSLPVYMPMACAGYGLGVHLIRSQN